MTAKRTHDPILWSTITIALLLTVTAVAGLFWSPTYARETAYGRTGGWASDIVDLFLVVPVLLISGIKAHRGSLPARLIWMGTQGYLLYNFVIYALGVHFNPLFIVYSATLGLCFYATIFNLRFIPIEQIAQSYGPRAPRKTIAIVFFWLALSTAFVELREDIVAILAGRIPQSVVDATTPVNFIHVLDLVFLLPSLSITAILLLRKKASGYALAPMFLTLLAIMSMELVSILTVMGRKGFGMNLPMIVFFAVLGVAFTTLLGFYLSRARTQQPGLDYHQQAA
jgi:hypothetical protein